jgi:lipoprotein-releasing system permease protein
MSVSLFIANKFVKSKRDSNFLSLISIISIVGIALGVTVVIIALTILNGFEYAISEKIEKMNSHIYVSAFGKRDLPDYKNTLAEIENELEPYVESVSPFAMKYAVLKSKRLSEGVEIIGIDPNSNNTEIESYTFEGKLDLSADGELPNLIVGKKLADKLFIDLKSKVTLFGLTKNEPPSVNNPPLIQQFKVAGIYESGMAKYDDINIYTSLKTVQEMFDLDDKVSGFYIRLNDLSKIDSLAADLGDYLGYPYHVRTIYKVHQNIFTWLELQKAPIPLILGLIIIVAVFNIIGTLLMIVLEKTNAVGILKSLGAKRKQIVKVFLYQGIYLSLIGIISGNILALALSIIQKDFDVISLPSSVYFISKVPIVIEWQTYLLISIITFILCIVASLIPSLIAARINPIRALRFD